MTTAVKNGNREAALREALDQEIVQLVNEVRDAQDHMAEFEETIRSAKDRLRVLLIQRGENWSDDEGYARLMSDSLRMTYDTKALDQLIIGDPLRHGWLKDYRKEFVVRGGIQVK